MIPAYEVRARNLAPDSDNKIHDDDVARRYGFAGALVPGVELFAYTTHPFVAAWGTEFLRGGGIEVRFRRPVYDGETVSVLTRDGGDGSCELSLQGPDGEVRTTGRAFRVAPDGWVADTPVTAVAARAELLPTGPDPLPLGPLASVTEPVTAAAHADYLRGISETLPLYGDGDVVHPGALLRLVNAVLMRNVALGPWVHTASRCRFLGLAPVPTTLTGHAVVTDVFERKGNAYVRYAALVLADDEPVLRVDHEAIYRLAD